LGGDEFALVLRDCAPDEALDKADILRHQMRDLAFIWGGRRYGVTLSVGVTNVGVGYNLSFAQALSEADAACFLAKEKGRNRVQLSHPDVVEVAQQQRDMDWTDRIRECLREDRVVLFVQRLSALQAVDANI